MNLLLLQNWFIFYVFHYHLRPWKCRRRQTECKNVHVRTNPGFPETAAVLRYILQRKKKKVGWRTRACEKKRKKVLQHSHRAPLQDYITRRAQQRMNKGIPQRPKSQSVLSVYFYPRHWPTCLGWYVQQPDRLISFLTKNYHVVKSRLWPWQRLPQWWYSVLDQLVHVLYHWWTWRQKHDPARTQSHVRVFLCFLTWSCLWRPVYCRYKTTCFARGLNYKLIVEALAQEASLALPLSTVSCLRVPFK